jgi:hypothetical protein
MLKGKACYSWFKINTAFHWIPLIIKDINDNKLIYL